MHAVFALGVAGGLHLAGFAAWSSGPGSADSAGDGGGNLISLAAASGDLGALVAVWDRPPVIPDAQAQAPDALGLPDAPPRLPVADPPAAPMAPSRIAPPLVMLADVLPEAAPDMAALNPPEPFAPATAPLTSPKPRARPAPSELVASEPVAPEQVAPEPVAKFAKTKTAQTPQTKAAQASQKASGSGNGAQAGTRGTARAATLSRAETNSLKAGWGASIRAAIERKKRPPTGANAAAGRLSLRLTVGRDGALQGVTVATSSGNAVLDQAALTAVKRAGRFPPAPKGLTEARYSFSLPISFSR